MLPPREHFTREQLLTLTSVVCCSVVHTLQDDMLAVLPPAGKIYDPYSLDYIHHMKQV